MSVQVKRRRDTAANVAAYTGAQGELIVDLTNNRVTVHDGVSPGGWAAAKLSEVLTAARTSVSDTNYSALISDRTIAFTAITAARVVTLPAASSFPTGMTLLVLDESGNASNSRAITLNPNGSDVIDGASSAVISSAYGFLALQSNGVASPNGRWTILSHATSNLGSVGIGTAADSSNPLSVFGGSALFNGANFNFTINKSAAANTASMIFEDNFSGRAQLGLTGDDNFHFKVSSTGSTWLDALDINASTGQPSFNYGIGAGEALSWRNRLRNSTFSVNQRAISGAVTLAAGAYGHDGVKAGASGATYTFAASGLDTTLTITAGSLIMPIEAGLIEGGAYAVQNAGTAQARVWQGTGYTGTGSYNSPPAAPTASPYFVTGLTANTQTNVEFSTGTVLRPQFEPGQIATAYERRPPAVETLVNQRYFISTYNSGVSPGTAGASNMFSFYSPSSNYWAVLFDGFFPTAMRVTPSVTVYSPHSGAAGYAYANNAAVDVPITISGISPLGCTIQLNNVSQINGFIFNFIASAEL